MEIEQDPTGVSATAQSVLENTEILLNELYSQLGLKSNSLESDIAARFTQNIQQLRVVLHIYRTWSQNTKDSQSVMLNRYLKHLKDQQLIEGQSKQLKKAINDCLKIGNQYLDSKRGAEQKSIREKLQQVADQCSLQFLYDNTENDIESILGEDPVIATATLYSSTFVVDVLLTSKGEAHSAKLHFTDSSSNLIDSDSSSFDLELTKALKKDIELFTQKIKSISSQEKIFQSFSSFPIKKIFTGFSSELSQIYQNEREQFDIHTILLHHHGIMEFLCEGVKIYYFAKKMQILNCKDEESLKKISYSASIGIEKGNIIEMHGTSLPTRAPVLPVHFVLNLIPNVPISVSAMKKIVNYVISGESTTLPSSKEVSNKENSLQTYLATSASGEKNAELRAEMNLFGTQIQSVYSESGKHTEYILVNRVPFTSSDQLHVIFQILRQQIVFNSLFSSCFEKPSGISYLHRKLLAETTGESADINTVEIVSNPPELIGLTFLHPNNNNFITVDILIELNGQLRVSISTNPSDKPPCSNEYAQKLLEASHHIPLALTYILKQRS